MAELHRRELFERRLADGLFYLLLAAAVILTGWLAARHDRYWDWSGSGRNTLTPESMEVVSALNAPLRISVFVDRAHPLARRSDQLLARYRAALPNLNVSYLDPQIFPEQARAAEVSLLGQMLVEYRGRRETLSVLSEQALTAAIARLTRTRSPWVAVLEGHGERRIDGEAAQDLGRLGALLRGRGYRLQPLDLTATAEVPDNTDLLVLSTPAIPLFPGEAETLVRYLERGGNLLWLMDPDDLGGLEPLADYLGITRLPGILVDANVRELNIDDPTVAMASNFPDHPLTRGLDVPALFPGSGAFLDLAAPGWNLATPLATLENSWNETGPVRGEVSRDSASGELPGPLPLALVLTRPSPSGDDEQRVVVTGDGDFLSNAHLEQYGNRAVGLRMSQWITAPAKADSVPSRAYGDREIALTRAQTMIVGGVPLVVFPLLFLGAGFTIRRHRRKG
jgi:hypothetical protein